MNLTPRSQLGHVFGDNRKKGSWHIFLAHGRIWFAVTCALRQNLFALQGALSACRVNNNILNPGKLWLQQGWSCGWDVGQLNLHHSRVLECYKKRHGQPKLLWLRLNWRPLRCGWWRDKHWETGVLVCPQGFAHFKTSKSLILSNCKPTQWLKHTRKQPTGNNSLLGRGLTDDFERSRQGKILFPKGSAVELARFIIPTEESLCTISLLVVVLGWTDLGQSIFTQFHTGLGGWKKVLTQRKSNF